MIYFDNDKQAYGFEIKNPLCVIEDSLWAEYAGTDKWDIIDGVFTDITDTEEYQEKKRQEEQARIQSLYMTRSDFFDGTIRAFGADEDALLQAIMVVLAPMPIEEVEKKVALNNYKNALNFYRKHPLFTMLSDVPIPVTEGVTIRISSAQWDAFFVKTWEKDPNAYKELLPPQPEPEEEIEPTPEPGEEAEE